jgi:acetyltransferase
MDTGASGNPPLERDEIRETVRAVIESIAPGVDLRRIRADRLLREQIDLDSMDWLNVLAALQERLAIAIPEHDYGRLDTLDAIVAHVAADRRARPTADAARVTAAPDEPPPGVEHRIDGVRVSLRPIRPDDVARERDFIRALSDEARYQRFMATVGEMPASQLRTLTNVDQRRDLALAATIDADGREAFVGVARFGVDTSGAGCEFAVVVSDDWHGTGLAGILMQALIDVARHRGLRTMEGFVLATNSRMLKLARQLGFRQLPDAGSRETVRVVRSLQD